MKKIICLLFLGNLIALISTSSSAKNNAFNDSIDQYWLNSWEQSLYWDKNKKQHPYDLKWTAYQRVSLNFYICNTYYDKIEDFKNLKKIKNHAKYFFNASVKAKVIRASREQMALKRTLAFLPSLASGWDSNQAAFNKVKESCKILLGNIENGEAQLTSSFAEKFKKIATEKEAQPKVASSQKLNYPKVVANLFNFKNSPQEIDTILAGIKGADNNGNPFYSSSTMGKMYKKGYLGGYAMGVESYCPDIQKVSISTKNGNGVSVKIKENGKPHISWKFMNIYHSNGIKDGWLSAQQYRCNKKVAQSIIAAEIVSRSLRTCFFGVCQ